MSAAAIAAMVACISEDERRRKLNGDTAYTTIGDVSWGVIIGLGIVTIGLLIGVLIKL